MLHSENPAIEHKIRGIGARKEGYRRLDDRRKAFERVVRDHYQQLHNVQSSTQEYVAQSLFVLQGALKQPGLVEQNLLIDYIAEIIRFVENVGLGLEFSKEFMDKTIDIYRRAQYPLIDLYLSKAKLLRIDRSESPEREMTFQEARTYAETTNDKEGLLKVLIDFAAYYTEVSRYDESICLCQECEKLIQEDSKLQDYAPKLMLYFGMNYTPLFNYKLARNYLIQARKLLEQSQMHQSGRANGYIREEALVGAIHYLGRIAEAEGNVQEAMNYYVEDLTHRQTYLPEDLSGIAYAHLRIGDLLLSCSKSLSVQAYDHILSSQEIFDKIQHSSAGRVQVSLSWGAVYSRKGDYKRAREYIIAAREETRKKRFYRGELLCSVKLFWLELGHFHIHRAIYTLFQAMRTWRTGELRRNKGLRLFALYFFQVVSTPLKSLSKSSHTVLGAGSLNAPLLQCICPMHRSSIEDTSISRILSS